MRSLIEINVLEKSILFMLIVFGIFMSVTLFMNHLQEKRYFPHMPVDIVCFLISYMEFHLMVVTASAIYDGLNVTGWRVEWMKQPTVLYIAIQSITSIVVTILFVKDNQWRKGHLSTNSIKESMDFLPCGICCYYEGGMPRLINQKMYDISTEIFGEAISNAAQFWQRINEEMITDRAKRQKENQVPTWVIDDNTVWSFTREKISYEKGYLYEILAMDVTEEYEKTQKLTEENERMRIITEKLKDYSKNVDRITVEKEILDAKVRIHSELGQTLVATRRYLAVQDIDREALLRMWNKNIKLLKKEGISIPSDDYEILKVNAEQLGIKLRMPKKLPMDRESREIIIEAVNECITNSFKYADSKELQIKVSQESSSWVLQVINEGDIPTDEIKERGGLKNLRKMIEGKGGTMAVSEKPCFCLTITMRKEGILYG